MANTLVKTPHPVTLEGQEHIYVELHPGESLFAVLNRTLGEQLDGELWNATVAGVDIPREAWHDCYPKDGQLIELTGDLGRSALALVAVVALSIWTAGAFSAVAAGGSAFGLSGVAGYAAIAGVQVAGSLLINKVLGPKVPDAASGGGGNNPYSLSGSANQRRPYGAVPICFGKPRVAPDLLSNTYTYFDRDDMYLNMLLSWGIGVGRIGELYNGDNLISSYDDAAQVWNAGFTNMANQVIPLFGNTDSQPGGALQEENGDDETLLTVIRTTSTNTVRIQADIQGTLYDRTSKGKDKDNQETFLMDYRPVGTTSWLPGVTRRIVNRNQNTLRFTLIIDVPEGQYDVRVRRAGQDTTGSGAEIAFAVDSILSVQRDTSTYDGIARTGLSLRATNRLAGAPSEIRAQAYAAPIPVWTGTQWVTQETSNPGAHMLKYLRGYYSPTGRLIAGMGLADTEIDIPAYQAFMVHCDRYGFTYDYWLATERDHITVLDTISAAGLGQFTDANGLQSVCWVAEDQAIDGTVNMARIRKGTFRVDYSLVATADGVVVRYWDKEKGEEATLRVPMPGVTTILNPAFIDLEGVLTEEQAAFMGRYYLAQSLYQYKDVSYGTNLENLTYRRLSLLQMQHDMTQWGYGGVVESLTVDNLGRATVTLDEPVPPPEAGKQAYIGIRVPGQRSATVFRVVGFTEPSRTIQLVDPWPAELARPGNSSGNAAFDSIWIYDFKETPGLTVRVVNISRAADRGATVSVVQESAEFWTYVKTGEYVPADSGSLLRTRPVASNLIITEQQQVIGDVVQDQLAVSFQIDGPYERSVVLLTNSDGSLTPVAETTTRSAVFNIPQPGEYIVTVVPYNPQGLRGTSVTKVHTTVSAGAPPVLVDYFDVELLAGGLRRFVWGFYANTIQSPDLAGVEVRYIEGYQAEPLWEDMTPLGENEGFFTSAFESTLPPAGPYTIALRTRNTSGVLSFGRFQVQRVLPSNLGQIIGDIQDGLDDQTQHLIDLQLALEQEKTDRFNEDTRVLQEAADDASEKADAARDAALAQVDALAAVVKDLLNAPEWEVGTAYDTQAYVSYDGKLYIAKRPNTGQQPDISPDDWQLVGEFSSAGEALAAVIALANQNASDIAAEASRINAIIARLPAGTGPVASVEALEQVIARVELTEDGLVAVGERIVSLTAETVGTYAGDEETNAGDTTSNAGVISVAQVAASATYSQAKRIDLVQAEFGDFEATVTDTFETIASQNEATAERITQVQVELEGEVNAVANNLSVMGARVTQNEQGITAVSNRIDSVEAEIDDNIAQAISGLEAEVAQNAEGVAEVKSRAFLRLVAGTEANPLIGGMEINNNGQLVQTRFQSDTFEVIAPSTANGFEVRDGYVRAWRGGVQRIIGAGFGANGDLMDYFGPNVGANAATKSMAEFWMDTGGSAYFGGSLSAGIHKNAARTDSTAPTPFVEVGPFQTYGKPRNVIVSFNTVSPEYNQYYPGRPESNPPPAIAPPGTSTTILLRRRWAGEGFVNVLSGSYPVSVSVENVYYVPPDALDPNLPGGGWVQVYRFVAGGSITQTDPASTAAGLTYEGSITSQGIPQRVAQTVSVISTEEP